MGEGGRDNSAIPDDGVLFRALLTEIFSRDCFEMHSLVGTTTEAHRGRSILFSLFSFFARSDRNLFRPRKK